MKRIVALALAGVVTAAVPVLRAMAAPVPPLCAASDVTASIAGTQGAAGTIHTTIALINVSHRPCTLPAYPELAFGSDATLTPVHVTVSHAGPSAGSVTIAPGAAGTLSIAWSDVDGAHGPCRPGVDAEVRLGQSLPLLVPIDADGCRAMEQSAVARATTHVAPPGTRTVLDAWNTWSLGIACEPAFEMYSKGPNFAAPAHSDSLAFPTHGATQLDMLPPGSSARNVDSVFFDAAHGVLGDMNSSTAGTSYTVCSKQSSVPYGIARASLAGVATHRGIRFGMTPAAVIRLDGPARTYSEPHGYSTVGYEWGPHGSDGLFTVFYQGRLVGIRATSSAIGRP